MALTELKIKNLKPREKRYLVGDGHGLYIAVMPTGEKYWYVRSWRGGRESKRSLGRYPDISLKDARALMHEEKDTRPQTAKLADIAEQWYSIRHEPTVDGRTSLRTSQLIDKLITPKLGHLDVREITPPMLLALLREIQQKHSISAGHRVCSVLSRIFRFAVAAGLCEWNPAAQINDALTPAPPVCHLAPADAEGSLRAVLPVIRGYSKNNIIRLALLLMIYTFVRPSEACEARWDEINADTWLIPAERMKMHRPHTVPLSRQAQSIIDEARSCAVSSEYIFVCTPNKTPVRASALSAALRRLGFRGTVTPHGFRGAASTILNEHGFRPDIIEAQLSHADKNVVRASYNRASYIDERRKMMQWYADYLDDLAGVTQP